MADAESMSADKEFLKAAAKGTWSIVEMVKNYTDNSGAYEVSKYINGSSNNEIAFTKGNNQGAGAVSFLSFNSDAYSNADHRVKIDFSIKGEGNTAIGIGLLVPNADGGDAPNTYGEVFHLIKNINLTPDGITEGRGVVNLNTQAYQSGRIVPPTDLFLGTTGPDAERTMFFSADAKGDEKDGDFSLEEDAWPADKKIIYDILPGSVIDVDIPYVSSEVAKIAGWIDFNRNGVFEPSERTMVATNPGSGTVRLSWTVPADFVKGKTFVRLRMSTLEDDIILPTGVAIDGEVEDHEIIIDDPKFKISKSSNAVNNIWNSTTSDKKYFLNITNIATVASYGTVKVLDLLPNGMTPNWSGTYVNNGWTLTYSGQLITAITTNVIASNATNLIEVPVKINENLPSNTYVNKASVGGGGDNDYPQPVDPSTCTDSSGATHCVTYEVGIVVPIDAVNDNYGPVSNIAGVVGNVLGNDTLGTTTVTTGVVTVSQTGSATNILVDSNGNVSVVAGTPSGTYSTEYEICEIGATPANCDIATVTVVVLNVIEGENDPNIPYTPGQPNSPVVSDDDTINDTPIIPITPSTPIGNVIITNIPLVGSPITVTPEGTITVTLGTPSGDYPFEYTICEFGSTPSNCETVTGNVIVTNPIDAVDDNYGPVSNIAGVVGNVLGNDTLGANTATTGVVTVSQTGSATNILVDSNGNVSVVAGTPSGTYTTAYEICEIGATPANCDIATVTVVVLNVIEGENDPNIPYTPGQPNSPVVSDDDTINGTPISPITPSNPTGNVIITNIPLVGSPIIVTPEGTITVTPGTPSGDYPFEYTICEFGSTPSNCETVTGNVIVTNPIDAVDDSFGNVNSGANLGNIYTNDTFNTNPIDPSDITIVVNGPDADNVTINSDGSISVNDGVLPGNYSFTYTICELGATPANCDTATVTFTVNQGPETTGIIVSTSPNTPVSDQVTIIPGSGTITSVTTPNVLALGAVADFGAQNCQYTTKVDAR